MKTQCVLLGKGLTDLPFGASQEDIKAVLGEPEETDKIDLGDETSIAWHYWEIGLSLNFDESKDFTLSTIDVADPEVTLFDTRVIGMSKDEARAFLADKPVGEVEEEGEDGLAYETSGMNLWFVGGDLHEVQFGIIEED